MTIASNPNEPIFYVYVLADPRKPGEFTYGKTTLSLEPFYVGKGKGDRYKSHHLRSSPAVKNKVNSIKRSAGRSHRAKIIARNLTEEQAYELETKLIRLIGRKQTGHGPLLNMNEGGPGVQQGYVSEATRARRAAALKKYWASVKADKKALETRKQNMGRRNYTDEERKEQSERKKRLYSSPEGDKVKRKLSRASKAVAASRTPEEVRRIYAKANATRSKNKRR
jgi:hypothetical protein